MRTAMNLAAILFGGVVLGLMIRSMKTLPAGPDLPGPDEVVFTPDVAPGEEPIATSEMIENPDVVRPPETEAWLSRFELTERSGKQVTSESLLGQPYVVSFFFARCPSICPRQNQKLKELQDQFEGQGVRLLAITVDPENDTPEVLSEYAARFAADKDQWLFLTGDLLYIRRIGAEIFQQPIDKEMHTERFVLVDAEGEIEGMYTWSEPRQLEKLKERLSEMLDG